MITVILAATKDERALLPTLAALVPGSAAGLIRDVIIVSGPNDQSAATIADVAGCHLVTFEGPQPLAYAFGARAARGSWLMFLLPGSVVQPGWIEECTRLIDEQSRSAPDRAAVFGLGYDAYGPFRWQHAAMRARRWIAGAIPQQGLLLSRAHYERVNPQPDARGFDRSLLAAIGRRRIVTLNTKAIFRSA